MAKKGEKMPLYEGEDGKLYFNFALGLRVAMHGSDRNAEEDYEYEIYGCRYIGDTEYYDVRIDGIPNAAPDSANRVKYLISRYGVRTLATGERQELPLTVAEVKNFYEIKEYRRTVTQQKVNGLAEYKTLKSESNALISQIGYAEACDRYDRAKYLMAKHAQLELQANAVLIANGIDPADIVENKPCHWCGGRGYIASTICGCALKHEKEIKDFNAAERLRVKALMCR